MKYSLKYYRIEPSILEVQWPEKMELCLLLDIMKLQQRLKILWKDRLVDMVIGYHTLAVHFKNKYVFTDIVHQIEEEHATPSAEMVLDRKRWFIPVCYDPVYGKDQLSLSGSLGLEVEELIQLHHQNPYLLYFYGFLPGFMYLGGLSEKLHAPRKNRPDPKVPEGSVAIGGKQTGIYPSNSPGGWHIIGKTPVKLFNPGSGNKVFASPADEIQFYPIDRQTFKKWILTDNPCIYSPIYEKIER